MPAKQPDAYPTPPDSSPQPIMPERSLDMHYYLTEGLQGVKRYEYRDIRSLKGAINTLADALGLAKADEHPPPYLILSPVTPRQLTNIDRLRKTRYKRLRILYLNQAKTLIVKNMPSLEHEAASDEFAQTIREKINEGGQMAEILTTRSTTFQGKLSSKEADGSFKPLRARPGRRDWPTIILECGVSETPNRLKADARWWFESSEGAVILVLLLFVSVRDQSIRIELWKQATVKNAQRTRGNDKEEITGPILEREIYITPDSVTGAPLELMFKDIFLRKPKKDQGEANYVITEQDMRDYYDHVWPSVPEDGFQDEYTTEEESRSIDSSEGFIVDGCVGQG